MPRSPRLFFAPGGAIGSGFMKYPYGRGWDRRAALYQDAEDPAVLLECADPSFGGAKGGLKLLLANSHC